LPEIAYGAGEGQGGRIVLASDGTESGDIALVADKPRMPPIIQPWGLLLLLSADWRIDAVSTNAEAILGLRADDLLGRPVASVLGPAAIHALRNRFALLGGSGGPERLCNQQLTEGGRQLDLLLHLAGSRPLVEAFPAADPEGIDVAAMTGRMAAWIEGSESIVSLGDRSAHSVRGVTGCDSVCVWKARAGQPPELIASYARPGFSPAPAFAAPSSAVRFIADCHSQPCPLLVREGTAAPDLAASMLGVESAGFRDYVCAGGASSGLLVPLIVSDRPWGWIIGLNRGERQLGLARLSVIELFARLMSAEIRRLEALSS